MAKVFGGGNVLSGFYSDPIGTRNASFVLEYLSAEQIPVMAQDLGDIHPRKVCFFAQTGRTLVKRLPSARNDVIVDAERAYYGRLAREPVAWGTTAVSIRPENLQRARAMPEAWDERAPWHEDHEEHIH